MLKIALPAVSVCAAGLYPPPVKLIVPVGVPLAPATTTTTLTLWFEMMLLGVGVTVIVLEVVPTDPLHPFTTFATFIDPRPVAASYPAPAVKPERIPHVFPEFVTEQS